MRADGLGVAPEKHLTVPEENALHHAAVSNYGHWHNPSMMQPLSRVRQLLHKFLSRT